MASTNQPNARVSCKTTGSATYLRRDVVTKLNYYNDPGDGTPPAPVVIGQSTVTNERATVEVEVIVQDISDRLADFTLDNCGFQFCQHISTAVACVEDRFHDVEKIRTEYFKDCAHLLEDITGAARVFVFDHKVRRGPSNWHNLGSGNASQRGPLHRVHVDQSYDGAEFLVRWYLPDEADDLLQRRWQIFNVWRPIATVHKDPLAVADARSVSDADLIEARVIYKDHERRTWTVRPPGLDKAERADAAGANGSAPEPHRWYYKHEQTADEVVLIKCFDSVADGSVARRVPHSAFRDAEHDNANARESIEIRAFVFY